MTTSPTLKRFKLNQQAVLGGQQAHLIKCRPVHNLDRSKHIDDLSLSALMTRCISMDIRNNAKRREYEKSKQTISKVKRTVPIRRLAREVNSYFDFLRRAFSSTSTAATTLRVDATTSRASVNMSFSP